MRRTFRTIASPVLSGYFEERDRRAVMLEDADRSRAFLDTAPAQAAAVDHFLKHGVFFAAQQPVEINRLLDMVRETRPTRLCEIGASMGGTLALLAHVSPPGAKLLSIDLVYPRNRQLANARLVGPARHLTTWQADSHAAATLDRVKAWLGGDRLDFLFIDGDHSYAGVEQDYNMFAPLVRPGGLVALHDINPDFRTRYGTPTLADVGEVPKFWAELGRRHPDAVSVVQDPEQDGYGIGVIRVS